MADARESLIAVLQLAYSGERAAGYAYRGHWRSLADPGERARIRQIEDEEWHHRELVGGMLAKLGAAPSRARELRALAIGRTLGLLCRFAGWLLPMYGAGRLERRNVGEYELAARHARLSGNEELVDCLLTMAEVEWDHEAYFRSRVETSRLGRRFLWRALPPRAAIRSAFAAIAAAVLLLGALAPTARAEDYALGPDSQVQPGVPKGELAKHAFSSRIFPGTERDYWVYVPKQYDPQKPAAVMVFQDGAGYVKEDGNWRVPVVFDNLIAKGEMPVTIGVFVNPGVVPAASESALPRFNRSFEYDAVSDRYARFLIEELLPEVGKGLNLTKDPNLRAIGGASSGAICAFTVAWERPDAFRRVFSTIGTYVGLRGGHSYSTLVRKTEPKPLRVFLQDGSNDLNIYGGDWWMANQAMDRSLEFAGYDAKHVWGDGAHDGKHGGSIFPDAMRWLWRDSGAPIGPAGPSKQPLYTSLLLAGEGWQAVGPAVPEAPAANGSGELVFAAGSGLDRLAADGRRAAFRAKREALSGFAFGPDGRLYGADAARRRVVAIAPDGRASVVTQGFAAHDLAVAHDGTIYATEPAARKVWRIAKGRATVVDQGIVEPSGIVLTPDQSLLLVADRQGVFVYSFQIKADGSLAYKQPYFHLHVHEGETASEADGMAVDANGYLYVSTPLGVQVCDQAGRVNGILARPQPGPLSRVAFAGPSRDQLYLVAGDTLYRRKTKARGVSSSEAPIKPAAPRL